MQKVTFLGFPTSKEEEAVTRQALRSLEGLGGTPLLLNGSLYVSSTDNHSPTLAMFFAEPRINSVMIDSVYPSIFTGTEKPTLCVGTRSLVLRPDITDAVFARLQDEKGAVRQAGEEKRIRIGDCNYTHRSWGENGYYVRTIIVSSATNEVEENRAEHVLAGLRHLVFFWNLHLREEKSEEDSAGKKPKHQKRNQKPQRRTQPGKTNRRKGKKVAAILSATS